MSEQAASTAVADEAGPAARQRAGSAAGGMPPDHEVPAGGEVLVEEELLVEEVSIDGMCGVY